MNRWARRLVMGLWDKIKHAVADKSKPAASVAVVDDPIDRFWRFWAQHCADIERAIEEGTLDDWVERIDTSVHALDKGLEWELGAGSKARHYLCISGAGDLALRLIAQRWLSRAPAANATWEFYPARPGGSKESFVIETAGVGFAMADIRVGVTLDVGRAIAHVALFHPAFAQVDEGMRRLVAYLALDSLLGEDDVERWIGAIDYVCELPPDAIPLMGLVAALEPLTKQPELYTLFEGKTAAGQRTVASVNVSVKRIDHLLMENLATITLPLSPRGDGLTDGDEVGMLNEIEDVLLERLGNHGVFIGHETGSGERKIFLHVAAAGSALPIIDQWRTDHSEYKPTLEVTHDPTWTILRRW